MGGVISRPINYVKGKVEDTRNAIRTKIENTKNAIYTRIYNTRDAIYGRVNASKQYVVDTVDNTKNGVQTRVVNTKNAVTGRINAFTTGVTTRVNNVVTCVSDTTTNTKNRVVNTKNAFTQKVVDTRNAATQKVTNARDRIHAQYTNIREAELTRKQKICYTFGAVLAFIIIVINSLLLLDLYTGDYEAAKSKIETIKAFLGSFVGFLFTSLGSVFSGAKVTGLYLWQGTKVGASFAGEWGSKAAESTWQGTLVAGEYLVQGTGVASKYLYDGSVIGWDYLSQGTLVSSKYIWEGSKWCAEYGTSGTKVIASGIASGSKVAFEKGSVFLQGGSTGIFEGAVFIFTNLASGSYAAAVYLYVFFGNMFNLLWTGSCSGSVMFYDGSVYIMNKTFHGSVAVGQGTGSVLQTLAEWIYICGMFITTWTVFAATSLYVGVSNAAIWLWNILCVVAAYLFSWTGATGAYTLEYSVTAVKYAGQWGYKGITSGSELLYIGVNKYGLHYVYLGINMILQWITALGIIVLNFLSEFGLKISQFVYLFANQIYNIVYIVTAFLFHILYAIIGVIKFVVDGLVLCVTTVFKGIILGLEETIFAYMFMLHKYNMYREILFFSFVIFLVIYCTGLMRDRRESLEEGEEETDEEEEEFEQEALQGMLDDSPLKPKPPDSALSPPPLYSEQPLYPPAYGDGLPSDDSDSDLRLDQDIPDFMHLSESEPEPDPPETLGPGASAPGVASEEDSDSSELDAETLASRVSQIKQSKLDSETSIQRQEYVVGEESGTESTTEWKDEGLSELDTTSGPCDSGESSSADY